CQGESGTRSANGRVSKFFEMKVLTSNSRALKILQPTFANPAPVAAFQRVGEGRIPRKCAVSHNETRESSRKIAISRIYFRKFSRARSLPVSSKKNAPRAVFNQKSSINNFFVQSIP